MQAKARLLGHPIHQMLIVFPLGVLGMSMGSTKAWWLAALDPRIQCLVPFNFGGPQPESRFPLPEDAEWSFNYMGGGSW